MNSNLEFFFLRIEITLAAFKIVGKVHVVL